MAVKYAIYPDEISTVNSGALMGGVLLWGAAASACPGGTALMRDDR